MRITITGRMSRNQVNERSSTTLTAKFYDDSLDTWAAQTPTSITYRIDCLTSGTEILPWTTVSAASSKSLAISSYDNRIVDDAQQREKRLVTVMADSGLSTQTQEIFQYFVVNNQGQV